ncbi:hypothetical protein ALC56_09562 [Trachymyrmex septentrionalis]|uniref:Uncharacterized protein n=1 Tax=Trachymyrmex septentrionalis TaxID=34720 RepID=A0A151JUN7_9HYME|nr:hypothetical protein ALC56_09562 [Trachymyrmex septentrionalis]
MVLTFVDLQGIFLMFCLFFTNMFIISLKSLCTFFVENVNADTLENLLKLFNQWTRFQSKEYMFLYTRCTCLLSYAYY